MNKKSKKTVVFEQLRKMSVLFDQGINQEKLEIYTNVLSKFDVHEVEKALKRLIYTHDSAFMPSIAKILRSFSGGKYEAIRAKKMSGNILNLCRKYGRSNTNKILSGLSAEEKKVLEVYGGLYRILDIQCYQVEKVQQRLEEICCHVLEEELCSDLENSSKNQITFHL